MTAPARTTTRAGWRTYAGILKNRQPFRTAGALRGDVYVTGCGRLSDVLRRVLQSDAASYVVYSYATPIAWLTAEGAWRVPDVRYSVTTSRHQSLIGTAVSQLH